MTATPTCAPGRTSAASSSTAERAGRSGSGAEHRHRHLGCQLPVGHLDGHADTDIAQVAIDQVCHQARALFEVHNGGDIRQAFGEGRQVVYVDGRVRVQGAPTGRRSPAELVAPAERAQCPGVVVVTTAGFAMGQQQLTFARPVPEGTALRFDGRQVSTGSGVRHRVSIAPEAVRRRGGTLVRGDSPVTAPIGT